MNFTFGILNATRFANQAKKEAEQLAAPLLAEMEEVKRQQLNYLLADYINDLAEKRGLATPGVPYSGRQTKTGEPVDEFRNELFLRKTIEMMKRETAHD